MKSVTLLLSVASLSSLARAHGTLSLFVADEVPYVGPKSLDVSAPPTEYSPIRQISTLEPITDPTSSSMSCGPGAAWVAPNIAPVTAGSFMTFLYRAGTDAAFWPHNVGPLMTYLYQCPPPRMADQCSPPPAGTPGWFKISELGRKDNGDWWQADLKANRSVPVMLPVSVPDGHYLLRFEVLALQNAMSAGGAEFYVSCTQIVVMKSPTYDNPSDQGAQLVAFPGAYTASDPGILVDVYDSAQYTFPGPPAFGASDEPIVTPGWGPPDPTTAPPSDPTAASTAVPKCKLRTTRPKNPLQGRRLHTKGRPSPRRVLWRSSRNY